MEVADGEGLSELSEGREVPFEASPIEGFERGLLTTFLSRYEALEGLLPSLLRLKATLLPVPITASAFSIKVSYPCQS
jgi:hypothetical protein